MIDWSPRPGVGTVYWGGGTWRFLKSGRLVFPAIFLEILTMEQVRNI